MKTILYSIAFVAVVILVLWITEIRDRKVFEGIMKYEECVQVEYGTTPSAWYQQYGEYPECER